MIMGSFGDYFLQFPQKMSASFACKLAASCRVGYTYSCDTITRILVFSLHVFQFKLFQNIVQPHVRNGISIWRTSQI